MLNIKIEGIGDLRRAYDSRKAKGAYNAALNRAAIATRAAAQREIRGHYAVKAAIIRRRTFLQRSTMRNLSASVWFGGNPIGSQWFTIGQNKRAAWARIRKGGRIKFDRAFRWRNPGGKMMLLQRKTTRRRPLQDPVRDVERPSIAKMVSRRVGAVMRARDAAFEKNLRHELQRRFRR